MQQRRASDARAALHERMRALARAILPSLRWPEFHMKFSNGAQSYIPNKDLLACMANQEGGEVITILYPEGLVNSMSQHVDELQVEVDELHARVDALENVIDCACTGLTDSINCSGNNAETSLHYVKRLRSALPKTTEPPTTTPQ